MDIQKICINKNRGWRGLAEIDCMDSENRTQMKMIFSFSQPVWDDMQDGYIVVQDNENYYVLEINNTDALPKGQRSVLLKYFRADVVNKSVYSKKDWAQASLSKGHYDKIGHFIKNRNNHTQSSWNCIGVRVVPMI